MAISTIVGQEGDDNIFGSGVADTLTGNAGNDTFRYEEAQIGSAGDIIADFLAGGTEDAIGYNGIAPRNGSTSGTVSYTAATALGQDVSNATVIGVNVDVSEIEPIVTP